jgi:hypothetical protein
MPLYEFDELSMSLSCKCIKPFIDLIQMPDTLKTKTSVGIRDLEPFKDIIRDSLDLIYEVERQCPIPPVSEHVRGHLERALEMSRRERTITTTMLYEAEEGINDSIFELKHALYRYCEAQRKS